MARLYKKELTRLLGGQRPTLLTDSLPGGLPASLKPPTSLGLPISPLFPNMEEMQRGGNPADFHQVYLDYCKAVDYINAIHPQKERNI